MKRFCASALLAVAATLLVGDLAQATVTALGYYRLGEADAGAVAGNPVNATTMDSSGLGNNLNTYGTGTNYTASIAASAAACTNSTLSMEFTTGGFELRVPPLTQTVDNWGLEGWFKIANPDPGINQPLVTNGNPAAGSGYSLYLVQGKVMVYFAGIAVLDSGFAPEANEWFYAAGVRDNGVTSMYINSATPVANTSPVTPNVPGDWFNIAASGASEAFLGSADEVRMFTFEPGAFNASTDLLIAVPEPSTFALLTMGLCGLIAYAWRKQR